MRDAITDRHHGETVYVVGKGPSLIGFDFEKLRGRAVIVINSVVRRMPFAPYWIFYDNHWFAAHVEYFREFEGDLIFARNFNGTILPRDGRIVFYQEMLTRIPARRFGEPLYYGNSTAVAATNLAAVMGAARIELLGMDLGDAGTGRNSLDPQDGPIFSHKVYMISQSFKFLGRFLQERDIEVVARCRYEDGEPQTNLRDWNDTSRGEQPPTVFRTLPLGELE